MDDADTAQVALAVRPPAAILAMDDTGALQQTRKRVTAVYQSIP